MPRQRIAVDGHLGVEGEHLAVGGHDQRVYLDQRRVLRHGHVGELHEERGDAVGHIRVDPGVEGELARELLGHALAGLEVAADERLGVGLGDLLHVHAPLAGDHGEELLGGAVEDDRGVVLGVDLGRPLDPEVLDLEPPDVHAEDRPGVGARLAFVLRDLDPPRLAASADRHLRLDHARVADLVGGGHRVVHGRSVLAAGHRHPVLGEELLALVLEKIHA
jgi:hypothetical protein